MDPPKVRDLDGETTTEKKRLICTPGVVENMPTLLENCFYQLYTKISLDVSMADELWLVLYNFKLFFSFSPCYFLSYFFVHPSPFLMRGRPDYYSSVLHVPVHSPNGYSNYGHPNLRLKCSKD